MTDRRGADFPVHVDVFTMCEMCIVIAELVTRGLGGDVVGRSDVLVMWCCHGDDRVSEERGWELMWLATVMC